MSQSYDPTDLRGQQEKKRETEAAEQLARETEIADLKWLMSSRRGRRILWRVLTLSGPFRLSFDTNAMRMAFNEGRRSFGNELFNEIMTLCPEMYPVMQREQQNDDGNGNGTKSN